MFKAKEGGTNDGSQRCIAQLIIVGRAEPICGKTGEGTHAEMNAINQLLYEIGYDAAKFRELSLGIQCEDKPCCVKCSAVLGLLNIQPHGNTYKSPKTMGSTQWCLPPQFRAFLSRFLNRPEPAVNELCGMC